VPQIADRRERFRETVVSLIEATHVAERESLAGQRISETDRRPGAGAMTPLNLDRLVEQGERGAIIARRRFRLPERGADLHGERIVMAVGNGGKRAFAMSNGDGRFAQPIIDVAEPVLRPGHGGPITAGPGPFERALEDRQLVPRRVEYPGEAEILRDPVPYCGGLGVRREPLDRRESGAIMGLGPVERRYRHRLVAGQLGIGGGRRRVAAAFEMIGEGLHRLFLAQLHDTGLERLGNAEMKRLALVQTNGTVDDFPRKPVLEAKRALTLSEKDEVLLGEARNDRVGRNVAGDQLEQPNGNRIADDRRDSDQVRLVFGQTRQARLDEDLEP